MCEIEDEERQREMKQKGKRVGGRALTEQWGHTFVQVEERSAKYWFEIEKIHDMIAAFW